MECPNCKNPIEPDDNFCPYCGFNLKEYFAKNGKIESKDQSNNLEKPKHSDKPNETKDKINNSEKTLKEIQNEVEKLKKEKKDLINEINNLKEKREQLKEEIDAFEKKLRELRQERENLEMEVNKLIEQKKEIENKIREIDRKEIELRKKEDELNQKYLELVEFENELLEEKKKIEENELNIYLAKELKDSSKILSDEVLKDITPPEVLGKEEKLTSMINFAREFLEQNMIDAAIHVYKKIEDLYYEYAKELPPEIVNKLHLQIVALYDDINLKKSEKNG